MNDSVPVKLADNEYYHGTEAYKALPILYEGFRLKKEYCFYGSGGTFKQGLYLTKSVDTAVVFGDFVFRCKLADGVSVLRVDEHYDQKIINSLRREFGKNILAGDITKAMPRNKHLKKKELIHLVNYRYAKRGNWMLDKSWKWDAVVSSVRQQLQKHKYGAIGNTDDLDGLAVLNPAYVKPLELYGAWKENLKGFLKELDKQSFVYAVKRDIRKLGEIYDSPEEKAIRDHVEVLLARYCQENGLPL